MRDLHDIQEQVEEVNERYRGLGVSLTLPQTEMLRDYSVIYGDLAEHRIFYNNEWLDIYNMTTGTNAHKTREADSKIREMYFLRHTMNVVKTKMDVLRSLISANKKQ